MLFLLIIGNYLAITNFTTGIKNYSSNNPFVADTPFALSCMCAFSASLRFISTIFSIPLRPKITGTPIHKSFNPYSPSNNTEHGTFFSGHKQ